MSRPRALEVVGDAGEVHRDELDLLPRIGCGVGPAPELRLDVRREADVERILRERRQITRRRVRAALARATERLEELVAHRGGWRIGVAERGRDRVSDAREGAEALAAAIEQAEQRRRCGKPVSQALGLVHPLAARALVA